MLAVHYVNLSTAWPALGYKDNCKNQSTQQTAGQREPTMLKYLFAALLPSLIALSSAQAQVTASIDILRSGNISAFYVIDEGDTEQFSYSYEVQVTNANYQFVGGSGFPRDATISLPNGDTSSFNFQGGVEENSGGGSFMFAALDEGRFMARLEGSADVETSSGQFIGNFSFNENSFSEIVVQNVAPMLDQSLPDAVVFVNQPFGAFYTASDPGLDDTLTFDWDFDTDGIIDFTTNDPIRRSETPLLFAPAPGSFSITVRVNDGDGGSDTDSFIITAIDPIAGDFDFDGDVDGNDFLEWQRGNSPVPQSSTDLGNWQANYGMQIFPVSAATSVPEPSAACLFFFAMASQATVRSRMKKSSPK